MEEKFVGGTWNSRFRFTGEIAKNEELEARRYIP
jgi:hypothetical protein